MLRSYEYMKVRGFLVMDRAVAGGRPMCRNNQSLRGILLPKLIIINVEKTWKRLYSCNLPQQL